MSGTTNPRAKSRSFRIAIKKTVSWTYLPASSRKFPSEQRFQDIETTYSLLEFALIEPKISLAIPRPDRSPNVFRSVTGGPSDAPLFALIGRSRKSSTYSPEPKWIKRGFELA